MKIASPLLIAAVVLVSAACSSSPAGSGDASEGPHDGSTRRDASPAMHPDAAEPDAGSALPADTGAALAVDAGAEPDSGSEPPDAAAAPGLDAALPPVLTPTEIGFTDVNPALVGSFIYWGNWGVNTGDQDSLEMIRADGSGGTTRFLVNRLWSFGVASDGKTIAFSSVDPYQETNWGVNIGDAIQYTFILKPGSAPAQLTRGNINDECHNFMPGDQTLLMCRRANFDASGASDQYRILTVDVSTGAPTFLTPLDPDYSDIGPALRDDGSILFWRQEFQSGKPVQSLMQMDGDGGNLGYVPYMKSSTAPRTSPDGKKVLFRWGNWHTLGVANSHDFGKPAAVVSELQMVLDFDFSPDLKQVVYTLGRSDANCDDVYVVNIDGTGKKQLIDCNTTQRYPSGVRWVQVQ